MKMKRKKERKKGLNDACLLRKLWTYTCVIELDSVFSDYAQELPRIFWINTVKLLFVRSASYENQLFPWHKSDARDARGTGWEGKTAVHTLMIDSHSLNFEIHMML